MNLYEETLKIFKGHVTAPTREKGLRWLFRTSGDAPGAPLHSLVAGILKAKLSESETKNRLKALIGMDIRAITPKPQVSSEAKALADEIRAELGLKPKTDNDSGQGSWLSKAYPSLLGGEPEPYDPLEVLNAGQREIVESFYGSGGKMDFGFQDSAAPEPADPEAEAEALRLYPSMKRS